mmetsp:Transcript_38457/g.80646  ORF Transcript_38457/g.80646 Transcript_38457/m.80646 type:complete len:117 (-) Transcript_38457:1286-1636(-)
MKKKYNLTKWPKTYLVKRQPNQEIKHLFTISSIINYDETINFKKNDVKKKKNPRKRFCLQIRLFPKNFYQMYYKKRKHYRSSTHIVWKDCYRRIYNCECDKPKKKNYIYFSNQSSF